MNRTSPLSFRSRARATLPGLPEELLEKCVKEVSDPDDLFAISRVGNMPLYRIATYELLKTNSTTRDSALYWACLNGDISLIRTTLRLGADVNTVFSYTGPFPSHKSRKNPYALTPLTVALSHQQVNVTEALLDEFSADINAASPYYDEPSYRLLARSPFQWILCADIEEDKRLYLVKLFLDRGANPDPDSKSPLNDLPLLRALLNESIPVCVFERFISHTRELVGWWPGWFQVACYQHCISEHDDIRESHSFTAIEMKKLRIMRDAGLSPDGSSGWPPFEFLKHAIDRYYLPGIKQEQLLSLALEVYPTERYTVDPSSGCGPWATAVSVILPKPCQLSDPDELRRKIFKILQMVLDAGIDTDETFISGEDSAISKELPFESYNIKTALACTCVPGYNRRFQIGEVMDFLVQNGTPVDAKGELGLTALHFASKFALTDRVKKLVSYGADVNAVDHRGLTPLHFACRVDEPINYGDQYGAWRSKQCGQQKKRAYIVRLLLQNGADPSMVDEEGATPLHYASGFGFVDVVTVLLGSQRVDVNATDNTLQTPLHYLPWNTDKEYELKWGVTHHQGTYLNYYPLPLSEADRTEEKKRIAELLIAVGADVQAEDEHGWLPITYAREYDAYELVNVFLNYDGADDIVSEVDEVDND